MGKNTLKKYTINIHSNNTHDNIKRYFDYFDSGDIFTHTLEVIQNANELREKDDSYGTKLIRAAYYHDLGRVILRDDIIKFCEENGHVFASGEKDAPRILHQIASKVIAKLVFGETDEDILSAVECHTTLKADPSDLDIILFLADKLSWKEEKYEVLIQEMLESLKTSKEKAAFTYLKDLHLHKDKLICYHIWSQNAYEYLKNSSN